MKNITGSGFFNISLFQAVNWALSNNKDKLVENEKNIINELSEEKMYKGKGAEELPSSFPNFKLKRQCSAPLLINSEEIIETPKIEIIETPKIEIPAEALAEDLASKSSGFWICEERMEDPVGSAGHLYKFRLRSEFNNLHTEDKNEAKEIANLKIF